MLADALEEAGCTNQDMLSHCRNGGTYVRGCWVLDLLLGKHGGAQPMNEDQWLAGTDPTAMLEFLRNGGKASERTMRLFACACCRGVLLLGKP